MYQSWDVHITIMFKLIETYAQTEKYTVHFNLGHWRLIFQMVFHKRLVLRMVTMSRPGNYNLSDWMYVMCGIRLPVCLHINIFWIFSCKKIKGCELIPHWNHCLNSLMVLGKLLATSVHPFGTDREWIGQWLCQGYHLLLCQCVFACWKVEMVQEYHFCYKLGWGVNICCSVNVCLLLGKLRWFKRVSFLL